MPALVTPSPLSAGTVPFRSGERIGFSYLISQKYTGDMVSGRVLEGFCQRGGPLDCWLSLSLGTGHRPFAGHGLPPAAHAASLTAWVFMSSG